MAIVKKKKRFFDVRMPLIQKSTQLQAYSVGELDGRRIMYDMTRILRGKSIMLQFVVKVDGESATSVPRELRVMPYFLRRAIRKGTHYVEDSFEAETKDAEVRIKPFMITRRKVSRAVRRQLRENAKRYLKDYAQQSTVESFFEEMLKNKVQKEFSLYLKKTYPLSFCEIRVFKVEKEKPMEKASEEFWEINKSGKSEGKINAKGVSDEEDSGKFEKLKESKVGSKGESKTLGGSEGESEGKKSST